MALNISVGRNVPQLQKPLIEKHTLQNETMWLKSSVVLVQARCQAKRPVAAESVDLRSGRHQLQVSLMSHPTPLRLLLLILSDFMLFLLWSMPELPIKPFHSGTWEELAKLAGGKAGNIQNRTKHNLNKWDKYTLQVSLSFKNITKQLRTVVKWQVTSQMLFLHHIFPVKIPQMLPDPCNNILSVVSGVKNLFCPVPDLFSLVEVIGTKLAN